MPLITIMLNEPENSLVNKIKDKTGLSKQALVKNMIYYFLIREYKTSMKGGDNNDRS